jgi:hypothetical protein
VNPDHSRGTAHLNKTAAACAGIAAGITATAVQIVLWKIVSIDVAGTLFRDARLAAAIILGPAVLEPSASFVWNVMVAASMVHLLLSIAYGLVLAPWLDRMRMRNALIAGTTFGTLLYVVNMYGFTCIFPWFVTTRDWITITTHISFGIATAYIYKWWTW